MPSERSIGVPHVPAVASPLLALPGAVEGSGIDAGVAWHYGDPAAEQRALLGGRAFVDQSHLDVLTVTGPDRLTWLHSLSSQDLRSLAPGMGVETMILSPQGRIEHVAALVDDGETAWLITETADALAAHLERMRFMLRVEVANVTDAWAAIGEPVAAKAAPGEPITWVDPWPGVTAGGTRYGPPTEAHPGRGRAWRLVLVPRDTLQAEATSRIDAGWMPAGTWATEAIRVAAWRPRAAAEVDATTLPHELDWLRTAVHLHKGCYRGQETVAKVHNVGRPPRRLVMLHLDGSGHGLPAAGAAVILGEVAVGRVTSAARHHEAGPIALALVKRSTDPSETLGVESDAGPIAAAQEVIVTPEGVSADRPPAPGPTARGLLMGRGCAADGGDLEP
jgi:folate-binding protein YgfZ